MLCDLDDLLAEIVDLNAKSRVDIKRGTCLSAMYGQVEVNGDAAHDREQVHVGAADAVLNGDVQTEELSSFEQGV